MCKEIKTVYVAETCISCHIISSLGIHCTKFILNSHKLLVKRGKWLKPKLVYEERHTRRYHHNSGIQAHL